MTRTPAFLRHYARVLRNEAASRPQHPELQETLRAWADKAEREAADKDWPTIQCALFTTA